MAGLTEVESANYSVVTGRRLHHFALRPSISWLRELDLNQRSFGYGPNEIVQASPSRNKLKFCAATSELHRDYLTHARRASVTLIATMVVVTGVEPA